MGFVKLTMN